MSRLSPESQQRLEERKAQTRLRLEEKERQHKIEKDANKAKNRKLTLNVGLDLEIRREQLHLSMQEVGDHIGITRERVNQIEHGKFRPGNKTAKDIMEALGYPRDCMETIDEVTPVKPAWVADLKKNAQVDDTDDTAYWQQVGHAARCVREGKGLSIPKVASETGIPEGYISQFENKGKYLEEHAEKLLSYYRFETPDQLIAHASQNDYFRPHAGLLQDLGKLFVATRILRTSWGITGEDFSNAFPEKLRLATVSVLSLENPENRYGKPGRHSLPSLDSLLGWITALYNADAQQPRSNRMLDSCPNVRTLAKLANSGQPFTAGKKHVMQIYDRAIDEIVNAGREVEMKTQDDELEAQKAGKPASSKKFSGIGLEHVRNTVHNTIDEDPRTTNGRGRPSRGK